MLVHGCDCSIMIKTSHVVMNVPYSEETIREDILFLQEEAAIEGDGICRGLTKSKGITGCVVTPLTLNTAPVLLHAAFGFANNPVFVSGTRDMYKSILKLVPLEDRKQFDLIQDRRTKSNERKLFEQCRVKSFELRIERDKNIKLKMDMKSEMSSSVYSYDEMIPQEKGERFHGEHVIYEFTDTTTGSVSTENRTNVYGVRILSIKDFGTMNEIWIIW